MSGTDYWSVDQGILVTPFPPNRANPPGVPEIVVAPIAYPSLSGDDPSSPGFTRTDWITVGLVGAVLVGLGVLLARSA